jgi:hypothetical protein
MQRHHNARCDGIDRIECHDPASTAVCYRHNQHDAGNEFSDRHNPGRRHAADERQREWGKQREWARLRQLNGGPAMFSG